MDYENDYTLLRDLNEGDRFVTKSGTEFIYIKSLDNDKHVIKNPSIEKEFELPHGRFPIFKKIT